MTFNSSRTVKKSALALIALTCIGLSVVPASAATTSTPKPSISTAPRSGGFGGAANSGAFAKYTACLAKAGIKMPAFGGRRGFGAPGTRPTGVRPTGAPQFGQGGPRPTASLSPAQQKAFTACAALRPSFGGFRPDNGGTKPGANAPGTTTMGGGAPTAPKTGSSPAYFACLKSHGLPVTTAAQVAGLDNQNPKVLAALKACAGK